ncbi:MAG: putative signal transducing protein [Thermodesulfovibrionales bacterium]
MNDEWTVLLVTYDLLEADMLKDVLESGDIPVELRSAKVTPYPVNVGRMGEVKVMVRESDREEAEALLRKFRDEPQDPGSAAEL